MPRRAMTAALVSLLFVHAAGAQETLDYAAELEAYIAEVERAYPFFELKGNRPHWEAARDQARRKAPNCPSDTAFLGIVLDTFRALHDSHMSIVEAEAGLPPWPKEYYPGISFMPATQDRVIVMWASDSYPDLKPGTVVRSIDGQDARDYLEKRTQDAWPRSLCSSVQRTRLYEYRIPFRGEEGSVHTLVVEADGGAKEVTVTCDQEARGWPHTYNLPEDLKRVGRSFFYTELPSGVGYAYLRRVDPSVEAGMREALEALPDVRGWIIDLRGNGGGGYGEDTIEALKALPRPVAALLDAGCVSAGETLARDLRRFSGARLFGRPTGGSSTSKRTWTFPSGIATLRMSARSRWRNDGEPIEFNGIEPDEVVFPRPAEVAMGFNTEIVTAERYILEEAGALTAP